MGQNKKSYQRKGISLKVLTWVISVFVFIISSTLIVSLVLVSYENEKVNQANSNYITMKQASNDIQLASDYLTDQARLFVANGKKKYMDSYFEEVNVTKRREKGLETIHRLSESSSKHEEIHSRITKAVNESIELMQVEFFAMKLICVDKNISCDEYPAVAEVDISAVAPDSRRTVALNSVLGDEYCDSKDKISSHINAAFELIDDLTSENSRIEANNFKSLIILQTVVIVSNIVFVIAIVLIFFFLIIKPMDVAFHAIEANEEVHAFGNRELNYIVDAYNDVRLQNEKVKEKLTYEAEHDKLTNIYNRTGYASLYRRMRLDNTLYILIDVDGFKEVNDEHGHDIGDKLLIRIAGLLEKTFSEDNSYIFRIGGDEFTVLIENVTDEINNSIVARCEKLNEELSFPRGKIPKSSLSIGIAHGDEDDTTDTLFKKADRALYKVKQSGKSGVRYYTK